MIPDRASWRSEQLGMNLTHYWISKIAVLFSSACLNVRSPLLLVTINVFSSHSQHKFVVLTTVVYYSSEHCRRGTVLHHWHQYFINTTVGGLERYINACTKGFDRHVLLPALNQEVQFDPNKFHLALDKKLCLHGDKVFWEISMPQ